MIAKPNRRNKAHADVESGDMVLTKEREAQMSETDEEIMNRREHSLGTLVE